MRSTYIIGLWGAVVVVLASGGLLAQEPGASPNADVATRQAAGNPANRWRYKFHNGHWWYYGRNNQWSYWDGAAWMPYNRQAYGQWFNRQFRPYGSDLGNYDSSTYPRRGAGTIQQQKNEPRGEGFGAVGRRPSGSIQRQKNESRSGDFGSAGRRPSGTIQREKNSPRGEED